MSIRKKLTGAILSLSLLTILSSLSNTSVAYADSKSELEFKSVIQKYNKDELVIENGISLELKESLDLSQYPNWKLSNNDIVSIDENGILTPIKEGTVFLTQQIGDKVHVIEVYVYEEKAQQNRSEIDSKSRNYYKVFLDPGHGGSDPGASGFGKNEKQLNMEISNKIQSKLASKGIEVKMSRTSDVYLTLSERAELANKYGADVFVSIHQNSADTESANGIETFHHENKVSHKPLSTDIQKNLIKETGAKDRGVKSANFGVLRMSNMTSALVECGFISNKTEYSKLATNTYQEKVSTAVANGIEKYLKENIKLDEELPLLPDVPVIDTGVVTATSLNVRAGYGTNYATIGTLPKGSKVDIYEKKDGWYKINYNNSYGFVSGSYIKLDSADVTPPPLPPTEDLDNKFTDIDNHWAKKAILDFANKSYINGYSDNTFRPNDDITRAEFVKVVNKVFGLTLNGEIEELKFEDVNPEGWYYTDLCIGVQAGYINGYSDNTFRPNGKITRQEAAAIVTSIAKLSGDGILEFVDNDEIAPWAKSSVDALNDNKIMGGYEDNTFRPKKSITRAEAVSTLDRVK